MVQTFEPNTKGYTIMAEAISTAPLPKARYGLRVLSWPEFPMGSESGAFDPLLTPPNIACDVASSVQCKKYNVLFR